MKKTVFRSKNIFTALQEELIDGYLLVVDNKIKGVYKKEDTPRNLLKDADIMDFEENFIMPGLHDFHVHLLSSATVEADGVLRYTESEDESVELLRKKNKDKKPGEWVLGGSWDSIIWKGQKEPTKKSLDKYFPLNPVFLINKEGHGAWLNSKALEYFNITKETPDPEHGYFSRFEDGEPTGYAHEVASTSLQAQIFDNMTEATVADYIEKYSDITSMYGITSVCDMAGILPVRPLGYSLLEKKNALKYRITFAPGIYEGLEKIRDYKSQYNSDFVSCVAAKDFIDGTPQGHTGYMLEDYSDLPGERSRPLTEPDIFIKRVCEYDKAGIQMRLHACGDAGVKLCLDAIEAAYKKNGPNDLRHCIEHLESVSPDDIPRFSELNVIASVQPEHMPKYDFYDHPFHKILGAERFKYSWPFESIRKLGGILAYGTDSPIASIQPTRGIFRSVTRLTNTGEPEGGFNPQEKVSVFESLKAYTYNCAYGVHKESSLGALAEGMAADIAIFEDNLYDIATDREKMFNARVLMTILNGKMIYQA